MSTAAARVAFQSARERGVPVLVRWRALIDASTHAAYGHVIAVEDDHVLLDDAEGPLHLDAIEDVRHLPRPA